MFGYYQDNLDNGGISTSFFYGKFPTFLIIHSLKHSTPQACRFVVDFRKLIDS
jgi:hypothetical protein